MWGTSHPVNINLYAKHIAKEYRLPEDVGRSEDEIRSFCQDQVPKDELCILTDVNRYGNVVESTSAELVDSEQHDSFIVCPDFYVRNKKLYLRIASRTPFVEWLTSLSLLCTSFLVILSNEIYYKAPAKLRLRAIVCMVAVPTVALMGLLMPFASYYFNRIVGDLDCWVNGFDNNDIARMGPLERYRISKGRCFAKLLQPYIYINEDLFENGNIYLSSASKGDHVCASRIVNYLRGKYHKGDNILIRNLGPNGRPKTL